MTNVHGRGRGYKKTSSSTDRSKDFKIRNELFEYLDINKFHGMESIKVLLKNVFLSLTTEKDDDVRTYREKELTLEREIKLLDKLHIKFYMSHLQDMWLIYIGSPVLRARRICKFKPMYIEIRVSKELLNISQRRSRPAFNLIKFRKDFRRNKTEMVAYEHPHVSSGQPCLGEYVGRLNQFAHEGAIGAWFLTIQQWMNTWNRHDAYWDINYRLQIIATYPKIEMPKSRGQGTKEVTILSLLTFGEYMEGEYQWKRSFIENDNYPEPSRSPMFIAALQYYIKSVKLNKSISFEETIAMFAYVNKILCKRTNKISKNYTKLYERYDLLRTDKFIMNVFQMENLQYPNESFSKYINNCVSEGENPVKNNLNMDIRNVVNKYKELCKFSTYAADYFWKLRSCEDINFMSVINNFHIKRIWTNAKKVHTSSQASKWIDKNYKMINLINDETYLKSAVYGNSRKGIMPHGYFLSSRSPYSYMSHRVKWIDSKIPASIIRNEIKNCMWENKDNPFYGKLISSTQAITIKNRIRHLMNRCLLIIYVNYLEKEKKEATHAIRTYVKTPDSTKDEQENLVLLESFLNDRMVGTSVVQSQT